MFREFRKLVSLFGDVGEWVCGPGSWSGLRFEVGVWLFCISVPCVLDGSRV